MVNRRGVTSTVRRHRDLRAGVEVARLQLLPLANIGIYFRCHGLGQRPRLQTGVREPGVNLQNVLQGVWGNVSEVGPSTQKEDCQVPSRRLPAPRLAKDLVGCVGQIPIPRGYRVRVSLPSRLEPSLTVA